MNKTCVSFFSVAIAREKCGGRINLYAHPAAANGVPYVSVPPRYARRSVNSRGLCGSMPDRTAFRTLCYKITARAAHISRPSPRLLCPRSKSLFLRRRGIKVSPGYSAEWHSSNYYDAHFPFVCSDDRVKRYKPYLIEYKKIIYNNNL